MLDAYPALKKMYAADDGNTELFYFKNGVATISSFTHEPKVIKFWWYAVLSEEVQNVCEN